MVLDACLWIIKCFTDNDPFWIGGSEKQSTGKDVDMTDIKKLQFICECKLSKYKIFWFV